MRGALAGACLVAMLVSGCEKPPVEPPLRGEFGIFFGGQIQERRDIPFELDRSKQTQGFRIDFGAPLAQETTIHFWIDKPRAGAPTRAREGKGGATGEIAPEVARVPPGETRFERTVPFLPGDPLGLWNVRVVVDGKVAIDHPFEVFDPKARERAMAAEADGG